MQKLANDALLMSKDAMSYLHVSRSTLYRLMESGRLRGYKAGKNWRFYREDLRRYVGRDSKQLIKQT